MPILTGTKSTTINKQKTYIRTNVMMKLNPNHNLEIYNLTPNT
jgi:hypothetical protein